MRIGYARSGSIANHAADASCIDNLWRGDWDGKYGVKEHEQLRSGLARIVSYNHVALQHDR